MGIRIDAYFWIVIMFVSFKLTGLALITQESKSTSKSVKMVARYKTRNHHETINAISNEMINNANYFSFGGMMCLMEY